MKKNGTSKGSDFKLNCFKKKNIRSLIENKSERINFEKFFRSLSNSLNQDAKDFLDEFSGLTGESGEWKFLSEKFKNKQLKDLAAKKHEELKKKSSTILIWEGKISDLDIFEINPSSTPEPVQKERKETKSLLSFLFSLLGKKPA